MWVTHTYECRWIGWDKSQYGSVDFLALGHRKKQAPNWELVQSQVKVAPVEPFSLAVRNLLDNDPEWFELQARLERK